MIRQPLELTTSIRPHAELRCAPSASDPITAGTNSIGLALPNRPSRKALRQENNNVFEIPCRRAVADAARQPARLSPTISSFF
jgi:hypothetical protein